MNDERGSSLQRRLLVRLWAPLFLLLMLGAVGAFVLARHIGSVVYDHWLFDSAMTLAEQVKIRNEKATLDLPKSAIAMFEWDSIDNIYEEVRSQKSGIVFSNATFPTPPNNLLVGEPLYYDGIVGGNPARVVAVRVPRFSEGVDPVIVQVAETRHKRASLVAEVLILAVPLQALILVLAGGLVWFAVTSSLRNVSVMAAQLAEYEPEGLVPIGDVANAPTEVRPLLESINRLIAKLADSQDIQRRFIANAAHQLRTPLAALQVQTERALREQDHGRKDEALSHVLTAVTRSRHLTHQLLTLARSEHVNEQRLRMTSVDLAELARDELERWADAAIARHIDLGYDGPEHDVLVLGEPHLLRELIGNLIDNAIRYGHTGGSLTLSLNVSPTVLTVEDDGPGIPSEERMLVVERFYRRLGASGDGCGLGLAIAHEIVARHGARLSIQDNPQGQGTRVEILFVD